MPACKALGEVARLQQHPGLSSKKLLISQRLKGATSSTPSRPEGAGLRL